MNNYEDWATLVAKKLKGEGDVIAAIDRDELDDSAAAEVFVRTVLKPFLPENFGIGAGRIVDAFGNRSDIFDIVIYNRSFPRIGFHGTRSDYLYESVLAAFSIRSKYVRKTFFESMDACASMARLVTNVDKSVLVQLARRNGLKPGPNKSFIHEDPIRTARFELIGSPPAFMFGFTGIKTSYRQLQENIELWIEQRKQDHVDLPMRSFPAVIATQGCFAWRNAAPLALSNREMLGIGNDDAPIRLIILQLLYLLNRRLNVTSDGYGLKPNLSAYLGQFSAPKFEQGVGDIDSLVSLKLANKSNTEADEKRLQPARDHSAKTDDAVVAVNSSATPVTEPVQQTPAAATAEQSSTPEPSPEEPAPMTTDIPAAEAGTSSGVFDKPSPFASAPAPSTPTEADKPAPYKPPTAVLGSAPTPGMASTQDDKPVTKPAAAPLGSAPIPARDSILDDDSIPPLPPIDIELTDSFPIPEDVQSEMLAELPENLRSEMLAELPEEVPEKSPDEPEISDEPEIPDEPDFEATMVIAPDATLSSKAAGNSTEAFIERVKGQLSESPGQKNEEPFNSTVPQ
jgi:hypothetical protein